jgi:SAM-dependent methyltransferase
MSEGSKKLKRCHRCGVFYQDPRNSNEDIFSYFSEEYIENDKLLEASFGKNREQPLRQVALSIERIKDGGKILDVGCAGGYFLERFFRKRSWETWGVELSRFAGARAAERGIHVHIGDIHSACFAPIFFDVITVLDTFYYFPEPRGELRAIRKVLKPDGLLIIELPPANSQIWGNESKVARAVAGSRRSLLQSHHVFFYTPKALSFILEECGFKVLHMVPLPGNRQRTLWQNFLYAGYFLFSSLLWIISVGRIVLGPRLLAIASPDRGA